jgi:hypothetical protein
VLWIFITLKRSIALAGFEPATFGSSGKHTNHYTTKVTWSRGSDITSFIQKRSAVQSEMQRWSILGPKTRKFLEFEEKLFTYFEETWNNGNTVFH